MRASCSLLATTAAAYGDHRCQAVDVFVPDGCNEVPTVLCLAGGWWTGDARLRARALAMDLAERGWPAAALGLRPLDDVEDGRELVDDVITAAIRAVEEATVLGAHAQVCSLVGSGSGSLLALLAGQRLDADGLLRPRCLTCAGVTPTVAPWDGCEPAIAERLGRFAPAAAAALDPLRLDPASFPPVLHIHGDNDPAVPARLAREQHRLLRTADRPSQLTLMTGLGHDILEEPSSPAARNVLRTITAWLGQRDYA